MTTEPATLADIGAASLAGSRKTARHVRGLNRPILCTLDGLAEGTAGGIVVIASAFVYHLFILEQSPSEFPWKLYVASGILVGLVFGAFAAASCGRLLDAGRFKPTNLSEAFFAWTAAIALVLLTAFLSGLAGRLSRVSLTSAYVVGIPFLLVLRSYIHVALSERIKAGALHFERVAVVGDQVCIVNFLLGGDLWRHGYSLAGALYFDQIEDKTAGGRHRAIADFGRLCVRRGIEHLVIVGDLSDLDQLEELIDELRRYSLNVVCAPAGNNRTMKFLDVVPIGPNNALRLLRKPMTDGSVALKRTMDIVGAGLGVVLLSPILAAVALAILVSMGRPVIYRQERRGFNGETFLIWKFRTMNVTESGWNMHQAKLDDPRITPVGRFLRATSIDELPQLINVLRGQMSLVGPRPHAVSHDETLALQMENYAHRQRIKPGITGWAQVNGYRGETSTFEQVEGRVRHDLYYIDNWSIFLDLWILVLSVVSPATRRNAR